MKARPGVVLDAGVFIAVERRDRVAVHLVHRLTQDRIPLITSAGVVAQVWRGGSHAQVPVAFLLRHTQVVDLSHAVAKVLGRMLAATRTRDPIDAHIVLLARERAWPVVSSDPDDLKAIDPSLAVERI